MLIGIFGGTFNPPHIGHRKIIEICFSELKSDKVFIIPASIPPHKDMPYKVADERKLTMTRLAFGKIPKTEILDIELVRKGVSYTFDTVKALVEKYGSHNYNIIIGTDNFNIIDKWKNIGELLDVCNFTVFSRSGEKPDLTGQYFYLNHKEKFNFYNGFNVEISSSKIREYLKNENFNEARRSLEPEIFNYIMENRIYAD
ncbi:MAG TPA: nicotinate (nicotinamide) nucleotide adenylyltransferase [bacterium]|nr:nicotinate (nicotinamide) nucleotide adenylyltransferase [bacterium]